MAQRATNAALGSAVAGTANPAATAKAKCQRFEIMPIFSLQSGYSRPAVGHDVRQILDSHQGAVKPGAMGQTAHRCPPGRRIARRRQTAALSRIQ
jgi:hypothetical protein